MKTHYELLGVDPKASAEDIKRAFRREIARYHPDKVQHLGPEFQEIAATRASELTEAYRVLMDPAAREQYDADLWEDVPSPPPAAARRAAPVQQPPAAEATRRRAPEHAATPVPESVRQARATVSDFVRKATLARVRLAIEAIAERASPLSVTGFDSAYAVKTRSGLFKKGEPPLRLLVRIVPQVDAAAVQEAWPAALKGAAAGSTLCLLMMGSGVASPGELSTAVGDLRRKSRHAGPVLVPVDFRDWEALFPPETPALVRSVIQKLKQEK